ncbi:MAG: tRNA pseudouridine(13) synthase TruD, partial [Nanoarchaeota archaeon]|nr:tRNA pseudouridine(13) synthase TruD [Nanoarchaeota archaeon]
MKIKQIPSDFVVEEIPLIRLKKKGDYSIYILKKTNMDLIAAKKTIARKFKTQPKYISYAGIKDKIAVTSQYISIKTDRGSRGNFQLENISLEHIGYYDRHLKSGDLRGNKFIIKLRDLNEEDIKIIKSNLEQIKKIGIPNYFDSQRFGEDLSTGGFIAKRLMKDDYEAALRLYLASKNNKSEEINSAHNFIHKNWKKWKKINDFLHESEKLHEEKKLIGILLKRPEDYVSAFKTINPIKKGLLISAYQSFLWNKCVLLLLKNKIPELIEINYLAGKQLFYKKLTKIQLEYLKSKEIPMLDSKTKSQDKDVSEIISKVLEKENINQNELNIKKMRNLFFRERKRSLLMFPE